MFRTSDSSDIVCCSSKGLKGLSPTDFLLTSRYGHVHMKYQHSFKLGFQYLPKARLKIIYSSTHQQCCQQKLRLGWKIFIRQMILLTSFILGLSRSLSHLWIPQQQPFHVLHYSQQRNRNASKGLEKSSKRMEISIKGLQDRALDGISSVAASTSIYNIKPCFDID